MLESSIGGLSYFLRCSRRALDGSPNVGGGDGVVGLVWPLEDRFSVLWLDPSIGKPLGADGKFIVDTKSWNVHCQARCRWLLCYGKTQ